MEWSDNQKKTGKVRSFLMHQKLTFGPLCFKAGNTLGHVVRKLDTFHWCCVLTSVACVCFIFFSLPLKAFAYFTALKGAAEERPLLWAVYVVVLLLPVLLISICLCPRSGPIKVLCFIYLIFL